MIKIFYRICIVISVLFALMFVFSYSYLNNLGLDEEKKNGQNIIQTFYRIQWPGNGSFLIGFISRYKQDFSEPFERYDLGGAFFERPWKEAVQSIWNKTGFWYINDQGSKFLQEIWIGVPSWLPVLVFGGMAVVLRKKAWRLASFKAGKEGLGDVHWIIGLWLIVEFEDGGRPPAHRGLRPGGRTDDGCAMPFNDLTTRPINSPP